MSAYLNSVRWAGPDQFFAKVSLAKACGSLGEAKRARAEYLAARDRYNTAREEFDAAER